MATYNPQGTWKKLCLNIFSPRKHTVSGTYLVFYPVPAISSRPVTITRKKNAIFRYNDIACTRFWLIELSEAMVILWTKCFLKTPAKFRGCDCCVVSRFLINGHLSECFLSWNKPDVPSFFHQVLSPFPRPLEKQNEKRLLGLSRNDIQNVKVVKEKHYTIFGHKIRELDN